MANMCSFVFFISLGQVASTSAATSRGLLAATARGDGVDTKAEDTIRALDTNGNGLVDKAEIAVFAKSQGLSSQEVLADFQELDANKDGELDSSEIGGLLGSDSDTADSTPSVKAAPMAQVSPAVAPSKVTPPAPAATKEVKAMAQGGAPQVAKDKSKQQPKEPASLNAVVKEQRLDTIDLAALQHDTQEQAGNVMASRLAQRAQVLLARSAADEQKAVQFDSQVRALRGNATALARDVNAETRKVARDTVSAVAQKSMAQLEKLQAAERNSEKSADEHRKQARIAMEHVRKAQASLHPSESL